MEHIPCNLCGSYNTEHMFVSGSFNVVQCKQCGFYYTDSRIDRERIKQLYSEAYFQKKPIKGIGVYSTLRRISRRMNECYGKVSTKKLLNRLMAYKKGGRILDIGCAAGALLKTAWQSGWETFGVEVSEFASKVARETFSLDVFTGTVKEASYEDQFFDVVTMTDVFSHLLDPSGDFLEINRILKDDGILLFLTGYGDFISTSLLKDFWHRPEEDHCLLNASSLKILLAKTGFQLSEAIPQCIIPISPKKLNDLGVPNKLLWYLIVLLPFPLLPREMLFICRKTEPMSRGCNP